jgi:hypothetical protein
MNAQTIAANHAAALSWKSQATAKPRNIKLWAGRILSALPALFILSGGINMSRKAPFVLEGMAHLGYPEHVALGIGLAAFACAILYITPRTSVLGAILLTAYLGGATASHVRVGDPFFPPVLFGVVVWPAYSCATTGCGHCFPSDPSNLNVPKTQSSRLSKGANHERI